MSEGRSCCEFHSPSSLGDGGPSVGAVDAASTASGVLHRLAEHLLEDVPLTDMYEGVGARLYSAAADRQPYEVAEFRRAARATSGSIADLACGSGRITLPLALSGRRVVAVDTSTELLDELMRRVASHDLKGEVVPVEADITQWAPPERFGLITLSATSIMLFDEQQRPKILRNARAALEEGGQFVLTHQEPSRQEPPQFIPMRIVDDQGAVDAILLEIPEWTEHSRLMGFIVLSGAGRYSVSSIHLSEIRTFPVHTLVEELQEAGFSTITVEQHASRSLGESSRLHHTITAER